MTQSIHLPTDLVTPALLLDRDVMTRNIGAMAARLDPAQSQGLAFRPHVKTAKCVPVIECMGGGKVPERVTVSTLAEAHHMLVAGAGDVLYAVGVVPQKLPELFRLAFAFEAHISLLLDSVGMARAVVAAMSKVTPAGSGGQVSAYIEVDVDNHRAGVPPDSTELLEIAEALARGNDRETVPRFWGGLRGVMTHAGGAYACHSQAELLDMAERERSGAVLAAQRLRAAGYACKEVSIGSTPTVSVASTFDGVTEVRVGVYVFNDLTMVGLGVCTPADIALSVLTTVIGHQPARNTLLVDAGWMALSSDRSTSSHALDRGLGLVRGPAGEVLADDNLVVSSANQEHGLVTGANGTAIDFAAFPIGSLLRILPVHACATAAQYPGYHTVNSRDALERPASQASDPADAGWWPRFGHWEVQRNG